MGVAFLISGWGILNLGVWLVPVFYFEKLAAMIQYNNIISVKNPHCLSGEFGIVYKSSLKTRFNENVTETVAVKTLKGIVVHLTEILG